MSLAKYRNAVWELFQCETKYLCNQLQPLEQVIIFTQYTHNNIIVCVCVCV